MFGRKEYRRRRYSYKIGKLLDDETYVYFDASGESYLYDDEWDKILSLFKEVQDAGLEVEFYELDFQKRLI